MAGWGESQKVVVLKVWWLEIGLVVVNVPARVCVVSVEGRLPVAVLVGLMLIAVLFKEHVLG